MYVAHKQLEILNLNLSAVHYKCAVIHETKSFHEAALRQGAHWM